MAGKMVLFEQGTDPDWAMLYQVLASANGSTSWQRVWNLTGLTDDVNYHLSVRNRGTPGGGRHFQALHSSTGAAVVQITDAGLSVTGTISGTPVGEVKWLAGSAVPSGFLAANGAAVSRTTYALLFAAIGVTWGVGDGTTTFNVPDMRGRFPLGVSGSFALGSTGGGTTVSASHTHTIDDHSHGPGNLSLGHRHSHSHGLDAHDHDVAGFVSVGGPSGTSNRLDGANSVASATHNHSLSGATGQGEVSGGGSAFSSTQSDNADISSTTSSSGATTDKTGMATNSGGSSSLSILNPYAALNPVIFAAA